MEDMKKNAERKINEAADKVREGVEGARRQGVDTVERHFPNADEAIEIAKAKGEEIWEKAKTKGMDLLDDVESNGQKAWKQIRGYVQKRPAQVVGYSLLVGLALGFLLAPKDND